MPSCSKALRGLSVLSRVMSIFTHTTISPGTLLRQCPSRYAIRAGRNLPDKEFRYLRTVIVTAAVHWGLSSPASPYANSSLNLPALGRRQPVYFISRFRTDLCFLLNSRLGLFTATYFTRALLIPKLRSHFAEFLNNASPDRLRILSSPTCVGLRYGYLPFSLAAFLASVDSQTSILIFCPHHTSGFAETVLH